jgi:tetratricopeptide (TPR) repeat protein
MQPWNSQTLSLDQMLALAQQAQDSNRLQDAEILLKKILSFDPKHPKALHLLGLVAFKARRPDLAVDLIQQAIKEDGKNALFHANLTEMLRLLGRLDEAIRHGEKAVSLNPGMIAAQANLGIAYFDSKNYKKASLRQQAALRINPRFAPALNNMGSILCAEKDDAGAMEYYRKAIEANPHYTEAMSNLGEVLVRNDCAGEALALLDRAIALNPSDAHAHCNRGYALLALNRNEEAASCFQQALQLKPLYPEAYAGLARLELERGSLDQAEACALKAIQLKPDLAEATSILGSIYMAQGRSDLAEKTFETALSYDRTLTSARIGLGNILMEKGNFKQAEDVFRALADSGTDRIEALFSLAQARKIKPGDPLPSMLEEEAKKLATLSATKAVYLHFALGKSYDDLDEPDRAFPHFLEGCRLKRQSLNYSPEEKSARFARSKSVFSKAFIDSHLGHGFASETPVFILGMPRSGTTLTEQIIASHPSVFGAGELRDLTDLMNSRHVGSGFYPEKILGLTPEQMATLGQEYHAGLKKRAPGALRITDKMPENYLFIGMIKLILPNAKIIHVSRHPLDTCLSCFTRLFSFHQEGTYDLYELGRLYREYKLLMDHWRAVLPPNSFMDIRYEDLVDDTETHARRLIEYCGLPWDEACLEFHKTKRNVRTASVTQVRQPIYKSSVARWAKYERYLGPLIEGLGEAME